MAICEAMKPPEEIPEIVRLLVEAMFEYRNKMIKIRFFFMIEISIEAIAKFQVMNMFGLSLIFMRWIKVVDF